MLQSSGIESKLRAFATMGARLQMHSDNPQHTIPAPKVDTEQPPAVAEMPDGVLQSVAVVPMAAKRESNSMPNAKVKAPTEAKLVATRLGNLNVITQAYGASAKLVEVLKVGATTISLLRAGKKAFTREFAAGIERKLKLDDAWLDSPHAASEVPASVWKKLGNPATAATKADGPPQRAARKAKKAVKKRSGKKAARRGAEVANAPVAAAKKTLKTMAGKSPGRKPGRPRTKVPDGVAAIAARMSSGGARGSASSAMAELLVNTIVQKSQEGTLLDAVAYRMLGELMELTTAK